MCLKDRITERKTHSKRKRGGLGGGRERFEIKFFQTLVDSPNAHSS